MAEPWGPAPSADVTAASAGLRDWVRIAGRRAAIGAVRRAALATSLSADRGAVFQQQRRQQSTHQRGRPEPDHQQHGADSPRRTTLQRECREKISAVPLRGPGSLRSA